MLVLATAVRRYLYEVLGVSTPDVRPWARVNELPYFLRDAFQFSELELLGHTLVLAMGRAEQKQSLGEVRTWLDKVGAMAGQPVVYVTDALREKALSALNMGTKKPQVITHEFAPKHSPSDANSSADQARFPSGKGVDLGGDSVFCFARSLAVGAGRPGSRWHWPDSGNVKSES